MKEEPKSLVQEKAPNDVILGFSKKTGYEYLSNFYMSSVSYDGMMYPSVEHAYQASKSPDIYTRILIKKAKDPNSAKRMGQSIVVRPNWSDVRLDVMKELIREKFKNPFIRWRLKETMGKSLVNENRWNDKFWGVVGGVGENWLGRILEEVREEIIAEDSVDFQDFSKE